MANLSSAVARSPRAETFSTPKDEIEGVIAAQACSALGLQIQMLNASTSREIEEAFATLMRDRADGLFVAPDFVLVGAGGLMSYGTDLADTFRRVGVYTRQILKGANPTDLPVIQSTKFEFVINLQTASRRVVTRHDTHDTKLTIGDIGTIRDQRMVV